MKPTVKNTQSTLDKQRDANANQKNAILSKIDAAKRRRAAELLARAAVQEYNIIL